MIPSRIAAGVVAATVFLVPASRPDPVRPHTGFSRRAALAQADFEQRLLAIPDAEVARQLTRDLSARPHLAGTRAQGMVHDYLTAKLTSFGLETWTKPYTLYLPRPEVVNAWLIRPRRPAPQHLDLTEPAIGTDPADTANQAPPFNAYGADGDVTASLVYVNYGLSRDYEKLDSLGVKVQGNIVIARYGHSFRGIKAREAERHGAVGLVLYSDPQDDGYFQGDIYPTGPMRPPAGIQRGSVMNANGDPTTPGYASVAGAPRLPEESLPVPHIPVIPMGYGNAQRLLTNLTGPPAPLTWEGGLPLHYHLGPGPGRLRLQVRSERGKRALHPVADVFARIRGAVYPDEWIVIGAHSDAWGPGAADNVSGTVTVLEAARAFATLAHQGARPARTIVFAWWDAEEWGLMGSTEWVEELEDTVRARVVAYLNEDDVANGRHFGGAASPSLKPLLRELVHLVPDPSGTGSVYDAWAAAGAGDTMGPAFDNLGGGSDFAPFTHHLGIPSAALGFSGPTGVYHSMYDSYDWMSRFGDPDYRAHRAIAQLASVAVARLANADIVPFDYVAFGTEMSGLVAQLEAGILARHWTASTSSLRASLAEFTAAARRFSAARDSALTGNLAPTRVARVNAWVRQVERRLTRPQGLVSRPWYRSLEFASDVDNGYSTMAFPSVGEAIRSSDQATTERELADLVAHVDQARDAIERATAALR